MYLLLLFLVLRALFVAGAVSCPDAEGNVFTTVKLDGDCPTISYISNVDFSRIEGAFYRSFSNYDGTAFGCDGTCFSTYVARLDDGHFRTTSCCRKGCQAVCGQDVGSGELQYDPSGDGSFVNSVLRFYILTYDDNYGVFYSCIQRPGEQMFEVIIVRTRFPTVNLPLKNKIFSVLRANNVNVSSVITIPQPDNCPHLYFN